MEKTLNTEQVALKNGWRKRDRWVCDEMVRALGSLKRRCGSRCCCEGQINGTGKQLTRKFAPHDSHTNSVWVIRVVYMPEKLRIDSTKP